MGVADFAPRRSGASPRRFLGALDEATGRGNILSPRETGPIMECVAEHEAAELADTGPRVQQREGIGVVVLGRFDDAECDVTQEGIIVGDEREIARKAFWPCRIGTPCSDTIALGFVGALVADRRQGLLAVGMLHMGQEFAAFAGQGHASARQVARGAHFGGGAIGLWEHPAA